ncbi:MAG: hypothetical protein WCD89_16145 [Anaerocolumna sp.]
MQLNKITTVLSEISGESIGYCQCHEHLFISKGQSYNINPALFFCDKDKTLKELKNYKILGGSTVVDAQPVGCNRMAEELAYVAEESGVNIIASTGFHKMCFYPSGHWIFTMNELELQKIFIHELEVGMYIQCDSEFPKYDIKHKAGIIKTAWDVEHLSMQYQKLFNAAVSAALKTKKTIMIHIEKGTDVFLLFDYLIGAGIKAENLIFCHLDKACDNLDVHKELCRRGSYLEYDTIGRFKYHSDACEINIIQEIIYAGYENQLLFSLDTTRERLESYGGMTGLTYILTEFIPAMRKAGITEEQIHKMYYENCKRALLYS